MWKVLQAMVLFATAGVIFSTSLLEDLGFEANPLLICAMGLGITTMLMHRSIASLVVMVLFAIMMRLPDTTLEGYNLDRQVLLAFGIALLCLPWIQRYYGKGS
ncbi:MAG: hypothetical protein V4603_08235 [Pseudomonadota bacterium]